MKKPAILLALAALCLGACRPTEQRREYYPDGRLKSQSSFARGLGDESLRHGLQSAWYPDGAKESLEAYVEGYRQGYSIHWYPNGRLRSVEHFTDGERDGRAKYWDESGALAACYDGAAGDCLRAGAEAAGYAERVAGKP